MSTFETGKKIKAAAKLFLLLLCIPAIIILGSTVFADKKYAFISIAIAVLAFVPLIISFENKKTSTRRLILISVMTALSVAGRFLFAFLPGFKPVTAMIVITAVFFGSEAGFLTGALTALISNFYFGQGPWTPFQMFAWGLIGFFAGVLSSPLKKSKVLLVLYGIISGIAFSLVMDLYTVFSIDNSFNLPMYTAALVTSLPQTVIYAVSNPIFLLLLIKPFSEKLERIKTKYGI